MGAPFLYDGYKFTVYPVPGHGPDNRFTSEDGHNKLALFAEIPASMRAAYEVTMRAVDRDASQQTPPASPEPAPPPAEGRSLGEIAYEGICAEPDEIGSIPSWDDLHAIRKEVYEKGAQAVRAAVLAQAHRELTDEELHAVWQESGSIPTHRSVERLVRKADALRKGAR